MAKTIFQLSLLSFILVMAQAVVFNHVCLFNVAVPLVFIFAVMKLPVTMGVNGVMTVGFFLGLIVDIFADTYGMNALAATITSALRRPVMRLYLPRGEELSEETLPSLRTFGTAVFLKYTTTLTLLFCFIVFLIESFTFFNPGLLLERVVFSTLLSVVLMLAIESLLSGQGEKRL